MVSNCIGGGLLGGRGAYSATAKAKKAAKMQKSHVTPEDVAAAGGPAAYIAQQLGVSDAKAKEYADAITGWSGSDYRAIRKYFFGDPTASYIKEKAESLQSFLEAAPKWDGGTTYRCEGGAHAAELKVGSYYEPGAPASWSTSKTSASTFGKTMFVCKTQKKGTSIQGFSHFANEKEVLVGKDAKYKVTKIYNGTGKYSSFKYIEVEEV